MHIWRYILLIIVFSSITRLTNAQSFHRYVQFEHSNNRLIESTLLKQEGHTGHSTVFPRISPAAYLDIVKDTLYNDIKWSEKWLGRKMFREHLLHIENKDWYLTVNPAFDVAIGREFNHRELNWLNSRGAQLEGAIGNKVFFYSSFFENQAVFPAFVDSLITSSQVVPGQGLPRNFGNGWDFANAVGFIAYAPSKYLNFQFGQSKHFIGDGYRSLFLSDAAFPAPFIRLQANLGKIQYTYWLFQHTDLNAPPVSWKFGFRQKYAAMGFLNWQLTKRLEIGAFQAVVWQADDDVGGRRVMPWQYLNPVIFLHPIQFSSGSEGNLLMGFSGKYRILDQLYGYGQFLLDEFSISHFFKQDGAARNKYAFQLGIKAYNALHIPNLFLQTEVNVVRPYTYSHWTSLTNYGHYNQAIAHPAGANFKEWLVIGDYRFKGGHYAQTKFSWLRTGLDDQGINYGQNILNSYLDAPGGFEGTGITIGQGASAQILQSEWVIGKVLNPVTNLSVELRYVWRQSGLMSNPQTANWLMLGVRTSFRNLYYDF